MKEWTSYIAYFLFFEPEKSNNKVIENLSLNKVFNNSNIQFYDKSFSDTKNLENLAFIYKLNQYRSQKKINSTFLNL